MPDQEINSLALISQSMTVLDCYICNENAQTPKKLQYMHNRKGIF